MKLNGIQTNNSNTIIEQLEKELTIEELLYTLIMKKKQKK